MTISTVVENVATAYLQLRTLDAELEITKQTLEARKQSLQLTQTLEQGGELSSSVQQRGEGTYYSYPTAQEWDEFTRRGWRVADPSDLQQVMLSYAD